MNIEAFRGELRVENRLHTNVLVKKSKGMPHLRRYSCTRGGELRMGNGLNEPVIEIKLF